MDRTDVATTCPPYQDVPERWRIKGNFIPKSRYTDPEFLALEREALFRSTWLQACRLEELPDVGSYVEFEICDESILIVRESTADVRAYFNACRHRGTRLARGRGRVGSIRCPFHAWQWDLDGTCRFVKDPADFPPLGDDYLRLRECATDVWGGWVFVNLEGGSEPLGGYLKPIDEWVGAFDIQDMRYVWHKSVELNCNWKTALDAFSEAYHVPGTHPQLLRPGTWEMRPASRRELEADPSWAPSTVLGPNVVRYRSESRNKDGENARYASRDAIAAFAEYQVREVRALWAERDRLAASALPTAIIGEDETVFQAFRRLIRDRAHAEGVNWPDIPEEVLHKAEGNFTVFPNMIFLARQGALLGYRSRPNGDDPHSCIFDVYALELFPEGKSLDGSLQRFASWRDADVGAVLAQDFENLEDVDRGTRSSSFEGQLLNPVQEGAILHHHRRIDEVLFGVRGVLRG